MIESDIARSIYGLCARQLGIDRGTDESTCHTGYYRPYNKAESDEAREAANAAASELLLLFGYRSQDLFAVFLRAHTGPHLGDLARRVDKENLETGY